MKTSNTGSSNAVSKYVVDSIIPGTDYELDGDVFIRIGNGERVRYLVDYHSAKKNLKRVIKHPERYRNPELIAEFLNNVVDKSYELIP